MRGLPLLVAMLAGLVTGAASGGERRPPKPMRVMSIAQCTDQLVLALLPPGRIASVTWLSRDPDSSLMARAAGRVPINRGFAEEVVRQRADLVIADSFATPATRALLKRLGYPLIEVDEVQTIDQIRAATRQVARAVGEAARGEALLTRMDRRLALLRAPAPRIRVAAWDGGGLGAQRGSLYHRVVALAGAVNIADRPGLSASRGSDVEALLAAKPTLLLQGGTSAHQPSLRDGLARHPAIRRYWGADRTVAVPPAFYMCGTPFIADTALSLRASIARAAAGAHTPLPFAGR